MNRKKVDPKLDYLDSDKDGLPDLEEIRLGLNPLSADTDRDGISDGDELRQKLDPLHEDLFFITERYPSIQDSFYLLEKNSENGVTIHALDGRGDILSFIGNNASVSPLFGAKDIKDIEEFTFKIKKWESLKTNDLKVQLKEKGDELSV